MTDGGRYSSVVLTCIVLTLGVSHAVPDVLYLFDKDHKGFCQVNTESATAHSGFLQKLVERENDLSDLLVLDRVAENELRLFADYIATVHAGDDGNIGRWVHDNLPRFADQMRMLEAAQYLQMGALGQCILSIEYTWEDNAWILRETRRETHLPTITLEGIVAYEMLRDADVTKESIQRKEAIVEEIRALLITKYGNIDVMNNGGFDGDFTVLHWATTGNHPEVVQLLLSIPGVIVIDFPRNPHDFVSPLQYAVYHGYTRLVELLLRFPDIKVDAGARTKHGTALHLVAAKYDNDGSDGIRIAELLVGHEANVDALNGNGSTALHVAAQHGRAGIVEVLLDHGANINHQNNQGWTPLHEAVAWNRAACVAMLISNAKVDINLEDSKGRTIFDLPRWPVVRDELARK